jgi:hypothetical protein
VIGYVVDVNFCVFDVSVEEFGAGFGFVFKTRFSWHFKSSYS